ncbi:MAG: YfiR family protein [Pseudomonadota bacterium]
MSAYRAAWVLVGVLAGALHPGDAYANTREDELKLAFTYNIARFVVWPEHTTEDLSGAFHLCVLGDTPHRIASDNLGKRRVADLPIEVINLRRELPDGVHCDLAYLSADADDVPAVAEALLADSVLTVSDAPGFATAGGVIELTRRNDRIAMRINVANLRRAGLSISSQLLSLATLVGDESGAD